MRRDRRNEEACSLEADGRCDPKTEDETALKALKRWVEAVAKRYAKHPLSWQFTAQGRGMRAVQEKKCKGTGVEGGGAYLHIAKGVLPLFLKLRSPSMKQST